MPSAIGIGRREAVLRKREAGLERRLVQLRLNDPEPLLFHNEALRRDGKIVVASESEAGPIVAMILVRRRTPSR